MLPRRDGKQPAKPSNPAAAKKGGSRQAAAAKRAATKGAVGRQGWACDMCEAVADGVWGVGGAAVTALMEELEGMPCLAELRRDAQAS